MSQRNKPKQENGVSLLEILVVLALIALFVSFTAANLMATHRQLDFDQFAREVLVAIETCRWKAFQERRYSGIVIEPMQGVYQLSFYLDGNRNGIRKVDIDQGTDTSFYRPLKIYRAAGDMEAAVLSTPVPEIPPKKGVLSDLDPIRFGKSNVISFSPNGQSSSGTLYLACHSQKRMYGIVLYGATAKISVWKYSNLKWQMVGDR